MAINVTSLDIVKDGQPWCKVVAKSSIDTKTLDVVKYGQPWCVYYGDLTFLIAIVDTVGIVDSNTTEVSTQVVINISNVDNVYINELLSLTCEQSTITINVSDSTTYVDINDILSILCIDNSDVVNINEVIELYNPTYTLYIEETESLSLNEIIAQAIATINDLYISTLDVIHLEELTNLNTILQILVSENIVLDSSCILNIRTVILPSVKYFVVSISYNDEYKDSYIGSNVNYMDLYI